MKRNVSKKIKRNENRKKLNETKSNKNPMSRQKAAMVRIGVDKTRVRKKSLSRFYVWQQQPCSSEGGRPQTALPRLRPPPPAQRCPRHGCNIVRHCCDTNHSAHDVCL